MPFFEKYVTTKTALISDCGKYRYKLTRQWDDKPLVCKCGEEKDVHCVSGEE